MAFRSPDPNEMPVYGQGKDEPIDTEPSRCHACNMDFQSFEDLRQHKMRHSIHKKLYCGKCDRDFKTEEARNSHHIKLHAAHQNLDCPICGANFNRLGALIYHIESKSCPGANEIKLEERVQQKSIWYNKPENLLARAEYGATAGDFTTNDGASMVSNQDTVRDSEVGGVALGLQATPNPHIGRPTQPLVGKTTPLVHEQPQGSTSHGDQSLLHAQERFRAAFTDLWRIIGGDPDQIKGDNLDRLVPSQESLKSSEHIPNRPLADDYMVVYEELKIPSDFMAQLARGINWEYQQHWWEAEGNLGTWADCFRNFQRFWYGGKVPAHEAALVPTSPKDASKLPNPTHGTRWFNCSPEKKGPPSIVAPPSVPSSTARTEKVAKPGKTESAAITTAESGASSTARTTTTGKPGNTKSAAITTAASVPSSSAGTATAAQFEDFWFVDPKLVEVTAQPGDAWFYGAESAGITTAASVASSTARTATTAQPRNAKSAAITTAESGASSTAHTATTGKPGNTKSAAITTATSVPSSSAGTATTAKPGNASFAYAKWVEPAPRWEADFWFVDPKLVEITAKPGDPWFYGAESAAITTAASVASSNARTVTAAQPRNAKSAAITTAASVPSSSAGTATTSKPGNAWFPDAKSAATTAQPGFPDAKSPTTVDTTTDEPENDWVKYAKDSEKSKATPVNENATSKPTRDNSLASSKWAPGNIKAFADTSTEVQTEPHPFDPRNPAWDSRIFYNPHNEMYKCPHRACTKSCATEGGFIQHLLGSTHNKNYQCKRCLAYFATLTALTQHSEAQSNKCIVRKTDFYSGVVDELTGGIAAPVGYLRDSTVRYAVNNTIGDVETFSDRMMAQHQRNREKRAEAKEAKAATASAWDQGAEAKEAEAEDVSPWDHATGK